MFSPHDRVGKLAMGTKNSQTQKLLSTSRSMDQMMCEVLHYRACVALTSGCLDLIVECIDYFYFYFYLLYILHNIILRCSQVEVIYK